MKDEIKEILDNFKIYEDRYRKFNETQFIIFYRDIHLLLDYITNLQQENKQLKERIKYLERSNNRREDMILEYRLEDTGIVAELEEWLKEEIENIKTNYSQVNGNYFNMNYKIETYEDTLDKIQKLKEKYK